MVTNGSRKPRPAFDLGHYSPNMKRPNWSPSRFTSSGSLAARKRSTSSKKAFSFCLRASMPCSMSSTKMRLSLRRRCFAIVPTCLSISRGSVMLRRTRFTCLRFAIAMAPLYTILVQQICLLHAVTSPLGLTKCLFKISNQVIRVFDSHGQTDRGRRHAQQVQLFRAQPDVRRQYRVGDGRFHASQAGREIPELQLIDEALGGAPATANVERDHHPEVLHLAPHQPVGPVVVETRIVNMRDLGVALERFGNLRSIPAGAFYTHV